MFLQALILFFLLLTTPSIAQQDPPADYRGLVAAHARGNGVPEVLVHRVIMSESRYNARAVGKGGAMGLMQIKHGTARAMGYGGAPTGLLDADTNMTYAVRYLAGAYRAAGGRPDLAISYYRSGRFQTQFVRQEARSVGFSLIPPPLFGFGRDVE